MRSATFALPSRSVREGLVPYWRPTFYGELEMNHARNLTRRSTIFGAAGTIASGLIRPQNLIPTQETSPSPIASSITTDFDRVPLWQTALDNRIVFGTSLATRQTTETDFLQLVNHEAAILFTADGLLWYKLRPTPGADVDFHYADQFMAIAEKQNQLVFGAHLVWDEGFGDGWTQDDLWGLDKNTAHNLLFDTIDAAVARYRGKMAGWVVVNEIIDAHEDDGIRRDYPWYETLGPSFIAESFYAAHDADSDALLVLNDFGFETDDEYNIASDKRKRAITVIDRLLYDGVPVHALGIQAHLGAADFTSKFDAKAYSQFLFDVADRGLVILISEMDVLDDGLPADIAARDKAIGEIYEQYLDVALAEPAVGSLMTFGLSDRYTWLQEDYPREDDATRRPLPFDEELQPKPAYIALETVLQNAPSRGLIWRVPRGC